MSSEKNKKMTINIKRNDFKKNFYEKQAWNKHSLICGIDEVGRGCLAGPVVTATAILITQKVPDFIADSKALSKTELLKSYQWLTKNCKFSIGIVNNHNIDKLNIWQATLTAMKKSTISLFWQTNILPSAILVDAMPLKLDNTVYNNIPIHNFIKGESKSVSIAAASIIAKVTRDNLIEKYDKIFPGYQFAEHKGYGTEKHKLFIKTLKHTIIHRESFLSNTLYPSFGDASDKQLSLFQESSVK